MTDRPKKPFHDAVQNLSFRKKNDKPRDPVRDKDNAGYKIKPPSWGIAETSRDAPRGAKGTKRDLPTPKHQKAKRFDIKAPDAIRKEFKSIASRSKNKDRGWER